MIAEALETAPDMAAAAARVRQAKAMLGVRESASAPQLSARASASEDKLSYNHLSPDAFTPRGMNDYGRATLDLSWSLDLWGKQRAAVAAAVGELAAVGLPGEQQLGQPGDGQRVGDPQQQGQGQQGSDCYHDSLAPKGWLGMRV